MVKAEVIQKRIQLLNEYLSHLRELRQISFVEFAKEYKNYGSAERFLQLAIEATIDLGNHIVAELNLGNIDESRDLAALV